LNHSESIANIAKALVSFQAEIKNPANTADNPFFKSKYAPLNEILNYVRPVLSKHGLAVVQSPGGDGDVTTITTLLMHTSGEWIETDPLGLKAEKQTAQGAGSAVTYGRRYSLSAALGISSEDDDDGNQQGRSVKPQADAPPKGNRPEKKQKNQPRTDIPSDALICHNCEAEITPGVKLYSERNFGRPLCNSCQPKGKGK